MKVPCNFPGDCIAAAEDACSLSGYTIGCIMDYFSCSCYHSLLDNQQNETSTMELGSGLGSELGLGPESGSGLSKWFL